MMRIQELLGVDLPIIQAPMAGVQNSKLALAVSSVGALGSIPCAMLSHDALRAELSHIQSQTQAPINVNFFSHQQAEFNVERDAIWRSTLAPYFREYSIRQQAEAQGSSDFSPLWCGQNTTGCKEISAAELTLELAKALCLAS
ncbi:protein of unknown function [Shewanella benthica]|uniref:Uncharacterized protein n=1 Tax=Shewanella benthica TaxID=43661 RepID=A0A330LV30_9GAMM|nr:nitronate monooxygenase [Shewanella benthica]SQH74109.1 protein of unknown function [Shewanella benthica]